jgi:thiosulfate dehydrogenase [quinone] large subunit
VSGQVSNTYSHDPPPHDREKRDLRRPEGMLSATPSRTTRDKTEAINQTGKIPREDMVMSIEHAAPVSQGSSSASGLNTTSSTPSAAEAPTVNGSALAAKIFAVLRVVTGFIFLWAALDKIFGLHYSTAGERAWFNGGSPTKGFLSSIDQGPFASVFNHMAGHTIFDILFVAALLGVGVAVIAGVAMRVAAVSGALLMGMMWLAEWPLAQMTNAGEATGSTNPIVDYHIIYILVLLGLAAVSAGRTWGLASVWEKLPVVRDLPWLH